MNQPFNIRRSLITAVACAALNQTGVAQAAEPPVHVFRTVPATPMELPAPLSFGGSGSGPAFQWTGLGHERILRNVQRPQLYPVRPAPGKANGRAVLVVPGGGYKFVAIENEGMPIARRLADAGYTAFVLVYRVKPTPLADADFAAEVNAEIAQRFGPGAPKVSDQRLHHAPAVQDTKAAMAWLKAHAAEQGFDAKRLSYLGFSAGAHSGHALVEQANADEMPDTLALIYGGLFACAPRQPVPPLFLAQAADDPLFPPDGFDIVQDWRRAGQRVELHLYERGGHGFGSMSRGTTADTWLDAYLAWLAKQ